jgi:hypothetical protein
MSNFETSLMETARCMRLVVGGALASLASGVTTGLIGVAVTFGATVGQLSVDDPFLSLGTVSIFAFMILTLLGTIMSAVLGHIIIFVTHSRKQRRMSIGIWTGGIGGVLAYFIVDSMLSIFGGYGPAGMIGGALLGALSGAASAAVFFKVREWIVPNNLNKVEPSAVADAL